MAKQSFVFCKVCKTMFLKSEVKDHSCPGCECDFDEYRPENWELDPFDPQSWSFGYKEFKVIESVHGKSSNEVLEIKSRSMATRIVEHLFLLLGGLVLCGLVLILIVLYSIDTLSSTLLFLSAFIR